MNRFIKFFCWSFLLCCPLLSFGQGKKPTLVILPSDNWCDQRYFMTTFEDQGNKVKVPDYQTAFREDTEIGGVVSQIGQMLTDLGYSVKDIEQEIKRLATVQAEDNVTTNSTGEGFAESPLDVLKRRTKADIVIQVGWQLNREAKGRSVSFTLEAFDSYTSKRIATATGISKASNDIVPRLLASAVQKQLKPFDAQMTRHFADLQANGREIVLTVRRWEGWENDLETEFGGEELTDVIQEWLTEHAVHGEFNLTDATENFAQFEQLRIPFSNEKGVAMDARAFTTELRKYLGKDPFFITGKVMTRGLGEAILVLGEK